MKHSTRRDAADEDTHGTNARLYTGKKRNGRNWWMLRYDIGSFRGLTLALCSTRERGEDVTAAQAEQLARDEFDVRGPITRVRGPVETAALTPAASGVEGMRE